MFLFDNQLITGDNNSAPCWHWREWLLYDWKTRRLVRGEVGGEEANGKQNGGEIGRGTLKPKEKKHNGVWILDKDAENGLKIVEYCMTDF